LGGRNTGKEVRARDGVQFRDYLDGMFAGVWVSINRMGNQYPELTGTHKKAWKRDCLRFKSAGVPFKVTGLQTEEHHKFVREFAEKYQMTVAHGDAAAYFYPPPTTASAPRKPRFPIGIVADKSARMERERQGKTFLVVEDSENDALLIRRAFRALEDCRAVVCRNLSEGRAYINGAGMYQDRTKYPFPNAIISDLHLGIESGLEFLKWVKAHPQFKEMPIYVLTGTASTREARQAKEAGAVEVLRKPAKFEDLTTMLNDLAAKLCG
jgi:CheY-like chemotaxis protein